MNSRLTDYTPDYEDIPSDSMFRVWRREVMKVGIPVLARYSARMLEKWQNAGRPGPLPFLTYNLVSECIFLDDNPRHKDRFEVVPREYFEVRRHLFWVDCGMIPMEDWQLGVYRQGFSLWYGRQEAVPHGRS